MALFVPPSNPAGSSVFNCAANIAAELPQQHSMKTYRHLSNQCEINVIMSWSGAETYCAVFGKSANASKAYSKLRQTINKQSMAWYTSSNSKRACSGRPTRPREKKSMISTQQIWGNAAIKRIGCAEGPHRAWLFAWKVRAFAYTYCYQFQADCAGSFHHRREVFFVARTQSQIGLGHMFVEVLCGEMGLNS